MTEAEVTKIFRLLVTDDVVFGIEIDSLLRQAGNCMTAGALLRFLRQFDLALPDSVDELSEFVREFAEDDPTVLIGFDDGRWKDLPHGNSDDASVSESSPVTYYFRLIYSSEDAAFYLFHGESRVLECSGVTGGARKREGAIHHVRVELSHPSYLQQVINRARECPHMIRLEESSETEFWAAPSQNPGY